MRCAPWLRALAVLSGGVVLVALAGGCEPTCRKTCRKLVSCGEELQSDRVTLDECEASCVFQERELEETEQDDLRRDLAEHKRCLRRETCADIADGVCLDEELAPF